MSIHESQFPMYLRSPAWRPGGAPPVARTVETTATVLFDLDVDGRVIGVEILGEIPLTTEWGFVEKSGPLAGHVYEGGEASSKNTAAAYGHVCAVSRRVTGWVEVDEKETGDE